MNNVDIKALIEKYYRAETSLEEEALLREHFSKEENKKDDPELADLLMLYGNFEGITSEAEDNTLIKGSSRQRSIPWYYAAAAAVAFLLVGVYFGQNLNTNQDQQQQLVQLSREMSEIKSLLSYQQISSMSASEKIQVAYNYGNQDSLDTETINTLISILQFDDNANVRLAAAEALARFRGNDRIRSAFLEALRKENNPVLQIKLIDVLILARETNAIPEFQRIMQAGDENEVVKERAAYGISQLI